MGAEKDWEKLEDEFAAMGLKMERPPKWKYVLYVPVDAEMSEELTFYRGFLNYTEALECLKQMRAGEAR